MQLGFRKTFVSVILYWKNKMTFQWYFTVICTQDTSNKRKIPDFHPQVNILNLQVEENNDVPRQDNENEKKRQENEVAKGKERVKRRIRSKDFELH